MKTLTKVERRTAERFARREARKTARGATYATHVEGRRICEVLLPDLAAFMVSRDAPSPPDDLGRAIRQLTAEDLALVALSPLLHQIAVGWKDGDKSAEMKLKLSMGRALHDKLLMSRLLTKNRDAYKRIMAADNRHRAIWKYRQPRWTNEQYVRAGQWLLNCVLDQLGDIFVLRDGLPCVTKEVEKYALELCAELVYRNPAFLPATEPLRDWTGWRAGGYWDDGTRISAAFARDSHPATEKAIRRAFRNGGMKQHVNGVNALQRVAWTINTAMLPVVERFAGEVGKNVSKLLVAQDIATANVLAGQRFYVPMNCDFRGRVYGIPHFNFQREDHVRSLFLFDEGAHISAEGINWLMIHVANCGDFDGISKRPWGERISWVKNNRSMIEDIARDPVGNVEHWRKADAPFSFVAGCIELAAAWQVGPSYITHLPVCFDGSCSGVQHLAMMMRDEDAARHVNLIPDDEPRDIYQLITDRVVERLKGAGDELADWWLWRTDISRKLIKRPAMTFAYSVTKHGMAQQLADVYRELHELNEPTDDAARHLAKVIEAVSKEVLPRPAAAMAFIRKLAKERADKEAALEWVTPTGFPWANRYHKSNVKTVHLESRGEYVRHIVADGFKPDIKKRKSMNGAAPNFVHALDASHLIRVVNAAARDGITSVAVVHDSFGCLASHARELHWIIRKELALLYERDVLADLREAAGSMEPLPAKGSLDPSAVQLSKYAFA
jgi:DNA-directed RNA polymerase